MKRRIIILLVLIFVILLSVFLFNRLNPPADACTKADRDNNNCVPAGKCMPPGHPYEGTVDCVLKDYDKKFETDITKS